MKRFLLPVLLAASLALALLPPNVEADTGSFYLLSEDAIRETDDDVYSPESHLDNPALPIVPGDPLYAPNAEADTGSFYLLSEDAIRETDDDVYSPESHLDNPALPIVPGDPLYAPN